MNNRLLVLLFCAVAVALSSCKDKDFPQAVPPTTPLMVVNATGDTINYYINGTRQNNISSLYPGGNAGYLPAITGLQNYQFKKAGSPVVLFNMPNKLDSSLYYSMFVGGESAANTFLTVDNLAGADTLLAHDKKNTSAIIRYVNASPTGINLDITEDKGDTLNLKGCAFGLVSPYIAIKSGTKKEFKVFQSGGTVPQIDTLLTLQTGTIYTLFTKGRLNGSGTSAFNISLIINR